MVETSPVIAAIPNYNMGNHLRRLLPQLLGQGYARIIVLDDGSTDETVDVVRGLRGDVELVRSSENQGCTANRNQIIDHVGDGELIHFIDADMDLATANAAAAVRDVLARYADRGVGAVGGLVCRVDGSQEPYNYGPAFALKTHLTSIPPLMDRVRRRPLIASAVRRVNVPAMNDWPNVLEPPKPAKAFWLHEGNLMIYSSIFRAIGGYDPVMRNHGAQDLAIRLEKRGVKRYFDPTVKVVHHYIDVRGSKRRRQQYDSVRHLMRKHGFVNYLTAHQYA